MYKSQNSNFQHRKPRKARIESRRNRFPIPQIDTISGHNHRFEPSRTCPNQKFHAQAGPARRRRGQAREAREAIRPDRREIRLKSVHAKFSLPVKLKYSRSHENFWNSVDGRENSVEVGLSWSELLRGSRPDEKIQLRECLRCVPPIVPVLNFHPITNRSFSASCL